MSDSGEMEGVDEESDAWKIEFCTRNGQCASLELEAIFRHLSDRSVASILLAIEEFARPPRDTQFLCVVLDEIVEVFVLTFQRQHGISVLAAAHRTQQKIYILGAEHLDGQGHFGLCEKARKEAAKLLNPKR